MVGIGNIGAEPVPFGTKEPINSRFDIEKRLSARIDKETNLRSPAHDIKRLFKLRIDRGEMADEILGHLELFCGRFGLGKGMC